jgi:hypothetical protein
MHLNAYASLLLKWPDTKEATYLICTVEMNATGAPLDLAARAALLTVGKSCCFFLIHEPLLSRLLGDEDAPADPDHLWAYTLRLLRVEEAPADPCELTEFIYREHLASVIANHHTTMLSE